MEETQQANEVLTIEKPTLHDAMAMHHLAEESGALDVNSRYAYLLCARLFRGSCRVARSPQGKVLGFVTGIVDPESRDTLFVWQVAVHRSARGRQLGAKMITEIADALQVRFVEATVTPSNEPSSRMFTKIADLLNADIQRTTGFPPELFLPEPHEAEALVRVGPIPNNVISINHS